MPSRTCPAVMIPTPGGPAGRPNPYGTTVFRHGAASGMTGTVGYGGGDGQLTINGINPKRLRTAIGVVPLAVDEATYVLKPSCRQETKFRPDLKPRKPECFRVAN